MKKHSKKLDSNFLSYDYNKSFLDADLCLLLTFSKVHKRQRTASRILIHKSMSMYFIYLQSCTTASFFLNANHVFLKRGCLFITLRGTPGYRIRGKPNDAMYVRKTIT